MNKLIQFFSILFCSLTTALFSAQGADIRIPRLDEPMSFEIAHSGGNCGDCEWTMAHGTITKDTPDVFLRFIQRNNFKKSGIPNVVFYSPGGNLLAALKLGLLLREYNVFTEVSKTVSGPSPSIGWKVQTKEPGICVSACAYAFLGGTIRKIEEGSKLGVHQFSLAESLASDKSELDSGGTQALVGLLAYYIYSMGVDPSILFLAGSTNPSEASYLSLNLLKELRVTTDELDKFVFQGWSLEPLRQGVVAVAKRGNSYGSQEALSIFCRRNNRQPVLMMSKRLSDSFPTVTTYKDSKLREIRVSSDYYRSMIFSSKLSTDTGLNRQYDNDFGIDGIRFDKEGWIYITTSISQEELNVILKSNSVSYSVDLPRSAGSELMVTAFVKQGLEHIKIALRNCVQ